MKRTLTWLVMMAAAPMFLFAQVNIRDSSIFVPMIYATYTYQVPGGDLANQFGGNSAIGGGIKFKTKSNWVIGAEGNYMFGGTVKDEDSLLLPVSTPEGLIIDANGYYADVVFYERGYNFSGQFGKIIPLLSPNPNCGFMILAGVGYLQNKIRINNPGNTAPQIYGDYRKGYDRLNSGIFVSGSLGYVFLSNTRLLNFYAGFEFMQAWTHSRRDFDFNTGKVWDASFSSQFYGIKVKWIIPLYRRTPLDYYLY